LWTYQHQHVFSESPFSFSTIWVKDLQNFTAHLKEGELVTDDMCKCKIK